MNAKRVSVVVPAFNEEKHLRTAIANIICAARAAGDITVEVLVVNDGSTDGTGALIEQLAAEYPFIRGIHHATNKGFGATFLSGIAAASYEWITLFPGDNCVSMSTFINLLKNAGKADMVVAYTVNTECRTRLRNVLSAIFSFVYTVTFNLHMRYINATPVYPVQKLRKMDLRCFRYSFPSEITVRLLRQGCTFMEVQGFMNRGAQKSSAIKWRNLFEAIYNYLYLVYDIFVGHRKVYAHTPIRILPEGMEALSVHPAEPLQHAS